MRRPDQTMSHLLSTVFTVFMLYVELSYSQKLIVEHERFQEIQLKLERMQKSYESQLQSAEDHRVQALEDLTQSYEAKVQEKTQLLAQVSL